MIRKLRRAGFEFDSHEIWWHRESRRRVTIPNHPGDIPEGTMRAIVGQMGLSVEQFLEL